MRQLGVSMMIGAMLSGSFRSTVGQAMSGIGQMDRGMEGLQRRVMDLGQAAASLYGLKRLVGGAAQLSDEFTDAAITADLTNEKLAEMRSMLTGLATPGQTGKSVRELLGAYRDMAAAGVDATLINDPLTMGAIGRAATATKTNIIDLAKTSDTLLNTLGVRPDGLATAINQLAYAGNRGKFELDKMSQYLPAIGAQAKLLGLQGTEGVLTLGAAFQVVSKTAGDSAEAANNLRNLFAKATSRETVENFKKQGVNLKKLLRDARNNGDNPFEVLLDKIQEMTKGDAFKVSALFPDQQAQMAVLAMLQYRDLYRDIKADAASDKAKGFVDESFAKRMAEPLAKFRAWGDAITRVGDAIGGSLLPPLGALAALTTPMLNGLADMSEKMPGTTMAITGLGAAMMILPPALRLVAFGIRGIGLAMSANPIGAIVMGIGLAAGVVYDNWETIKTFFMTIWDEVQPYWESFVSFVLDAANVLYAPFRMIGAGLKVLANLGLGNGLDMGPVNAVAASAGEARQRIWDRVPKEFQKPDFGILPPNPALAGANGGGNLAGAGSGATNGRVAVEVNFSNVPMGTDISTATMGTGISAPNTGLQMAFP